MASATEQKKAKGPAGKAKATGAGEQAVLAALGAKPRATAAEIAAAAGLGRSTAGKLLAALERRGTVRRTAGGREGARRLPDRWELAVLAAQDGDAQAAAGAAGGQSDGTAQGRGGEAAGAGSGDHRAATGGKRRADRLPAGALDGLVLAFMREQDGDGPHGPGQIGKAIGKSSGAVANALVRLARDGKVREVSERPVRYSLAG